MKKKMIISAFVGILLLVISLGATSIATERISVKYLKTSDGDTARVEWNGENWRVRFLGINTPEVSGENKVEEPYGNEALAYTKNKLEHAQKIEIEYDNVADKEDRFGRKLAWIWVDDELFELELLEQGLAKTYMLKNNYKYAAELKEAEKKAKEAKVGVWNEVEEESTTLTKTENTTATPLKSLPQENEQEVSSRSERK